MLRIVTFALPFMLGANVALAEFAENDGVAIGRVMAAQQMCDFEVITPNLQEWIESRFEEGDAAILDDIVIGARQVPDARELRSALIPYCIQVRRVAVTFEILRMGTPAPAQPPNPTERPSEAPADGLQE